jgi:hypothetical protein
MNNNPIRLIDPTGHEPVDHSCYDQGDKSCLLKQEKTDYPLPTVSIPDFANPTPTPGPSLQPATPPSNQEYPTIVQGHGIDINISINPNADPVDAIIDIAGIGGDIASFFEPEGAIPYMVTETAEFASTVKSIYDLAHGDPKNFMMKQSEISTEQIVVGARMGRLIPVVGSVGNTISLLMNLQPKISITTY